jgi:hypothetical protein
MSLGSLVAGAVANAYHPESSRGTGLTFETVGITIAGNAVGNLVREFALRTGAIPATLRKRQALARGKVVRVTRSGETEDAWWLRRAETRQYQESCTDGRRRRNSYPCVMVLREGFPRLANR